MIGGENILVVGREMDIHLGSRKGHIECRTFLSRARGDGKESRRSERPNAKERQAIKRRVLAQYQAGRY